jgi:methylenetetrahydrofolate reductase (NADPH)
MTTERQPIERLAQALKHPRYEVIPLEGTEEQVLEHIPKEAKVTVTASPQKGVEATLQLAEQLAAQGYHVAPHLSARLIEDRAQVGEILKRLHEVGIRDAFVVAGDAKEPIGEFSGAPELLESMSKIGHELEEIGIIGYPEGHPFLRDETLKQAMYEKRPYATYIVSESDLLRPGDHLRLDQRRERAGGGAAHLHRDTRCCKQAKVDAGIFWHRCWRVR